MPDAQPHPWAVRCREGILALNKLPPHIGSREQEPPDRRSLHRRRPVPRPLLRGTRQAAPRRQLQREHIQEFIADQLARWKPATAHNRYRSLHAFFKWALAEGDLQASPMDGMKPPNLPGAAHRCHPGRAARPPPEDL
jgi:hypothetical protein